MEMDIEVGEFSWDGLRKQARKLEGELDVKLSLYRKSVYSPGQDVAVNTESEIELLLGQLQQITARMQNRLPHEGSGIISHTLARHKDILYDLTQEFKRLKSNSKSKQEHQRLLQSVDKEQQNSRSTHNGYSTSIDDALSKERATVFRSSAQMDTVISQAQATFSTLTFQRGAFHDIGSKISLINTRLPSVNGVLSAIRQKKSRETIILSFVASSCMFLIFLYWLSK